MDAANGKIDSNNDDLMETDVAGCNAMDTISSTPSNQKAAESSQDDAVAVMDNCSLVPDKVLNDNILQYCTAESNKTIANFEIHENSSGIMAASVSDVLLNTLQAAFNRKKDFLLQAILKQSKIDNERFIVLVCVTSEILKEKECCSIAILDKLGFYLFLSDLCCKIMEKYIEKMNEALHCRQQKSYLDGGNTNPTINLFTSSLQNHKDPNEIVYNFCKPLNNRIQT